MRHDRHDLHDRASGARLGSSRGRRPIRRKRRLGVFRRKSSVWLRYHRHRAEDDRFDAAGLLLLSEQFRDCCQSRA